VEMDELRQFLGLGGRVRRALRPSTTVSQDKVLSIFWEGNDNDGIWGKKNALRVREGWLELPTDDGGSRRSQDSPIAQPHIQMDLGVASPSTVRHSNSPHCPTNDIGANAAAVLGAQGCPTTSLAQPISPPPLFFFYR
jgi:hypothetical protein